ncbi:hypothetical protein AMAG_02333 [Allomyces macrogynus ATCC 38327]|uniref:Alpha/beta hydrolase fold-3 domain-containing protein n=1 Tax=Allomyces macrogynus (strain ATCC 38327) TaxID=578462 RepID=A0A0L0S1T8_ALLM3|nr:hypothetical protein AMAG_02333 [Allomyces macrogynus ATCC 38327]|eukprot:KNE56532.1 hypothetical protein AMAG_02333 [Allomyces macrogynus ATCC 38327]
MVTKSPKRRARRPAAAPTSPPLSATRQLSPPADSSRAPLLPVADTPGTSQAAFDAATAPPKPSAWSSFVFFMQAFLLTVPVVAAAVMRGPERPNRPRGLDLFVRFFRQMSKLPSLNVYRARALLDKINKLSQDRIDAVVKQFVYTEVVWRARLLASPDETLPPLPATSDPVVQIVSPTLMAQYPRVAAVRDWTVSADWIEPVDAHADPLWDPSRVAIMYHGGAYIFSSKHSYRHMAGPFGALLHRRVFNVEYRLSPEAQFPDALHDGVAAYLYVVEVEKVPPENITLMGDSAGGNLAMAVLLFLRDHGYPLPGGAVLLSPWSDLSHNLPSYTENMHFDYINPYDRQPNMNPVAMLCGTPYYHAAVATEKFLSPVADTAFPGQRALPPVYISTGTDEILLDENVLLAANLASRAAGVVVHDMHEHQIHVFPFLNLHCADAARFRARIAAFVTNLVDRPHRAEGPRVEVAYFKDGVDQGPDAARAAWARRWPGIRSAKHLAWDPVQAVLMDDNVAGRVLPENSRTGAGIKSALPRALREGMGGVLEEVQAAAAEGVMVGPAKY